MANRLSHSQANLYLECPKKYSYSYREKIREKTRSGALILGSAVDLMFSELLMSRDKAKAREVYDKAMNFTEINGRQLAVPTSEFIVYGRSDFDYEVLNQAQEDKLRSRCEDFGFDPEQALVTVANIGGKKAAVGWWGLTVNERKYYNLANWYCTYNKGLLMLDALEEQVVPLIGTVEALQKKIELKNTDGDTVLGFLDLLCIWNDGRRLLLDLKTSGRAYEKDAVATSQQLVIYQEALAQEGIVVDAVGYIVLIKQLVKNRKKICKSCGYAPEETTRHRTCPRDILTLRCGGEWNEVLDPKIKVQILIDRIPERSKDLILENIDSINDAISKEIFVRNTKSCMGTYGKCAYFDLCWQGKMDGLEIVETIEKKEVV